MTSIQTSVLTLIIIGVLACKASSAPRHPFSATNFVASPDVSSLSSMSGSGSINCGPHGRINDQEFSGIREVISKLGGWNALVLSHNDVTDNSLADICKLPRIQRLFITGTLITSDGVDKLKCLPHLKELTVSPLQVNAHDASRVKALLGLEVLNRTFDDGSDRFHLTTREREEVIQLLNDPLEEIFIKKECQRILAREARQAKGK